MFALFTFNILHCQYTKGVTTGQIGYRTKKRTKDQRYVGTKERRNEGMNEGTKQYLILLLFLYIRGCLTSIILRQYRPSD